MKIRLLLSICFLAITYFASAQETNNDLGPLVTDRPDQTEASTLVPVGFIQIETGAAFESFKDGSIKTEDFTINTTLIRFGLLESLELRLGWDVVDGTLKNNGNTVDVTSGFSPLLFGVKLAIAEEKGALPEIGFIGHINLPFLASSDYKPETTGVDFRFAFTHTLSERSSLAYNVGAAWEGDNPEASYLYTIAYGYSFTDKLGAYAELYGDFPENSMANHLWDAGVTYLISDNVQLDATVGTSITEGQDLLISGGVSFRLPTK